MSSTPTSCRQPVARTCLLTKEPPGHSRHSVEPGDENVYLGQSIHSPSLPNGPKVPAAHRLHPSSSSPENHPGWHGVQTPSTTSMPTALRPTHVHESPLSISHTKLLRHLLHTVEVPPELTSPSLHGLQNGLPPPTSRYPFVQGSHVTPMSAAVACGPQTARWHSQSVEPGNGRRRSRFTAQPVCACTHSECPGTCSDQCATSTKFGTSPSAHGPHPVRLSFGTLPSRHTVQAVEPSSGATLPAPHAVQLGCTWSSTWFNVPAGHGLHSFLNRNLPAGHPHIVCCRSGRVFPSHFVHRRTMPPSLTCPSGHRTQRLLPASR